MKKQTLAMILILLGSLLAISSCGLNAPAGKAAISDDEARQIAEAALIAINEGDYEAFVENFADQLSEAMTEEKFWELRTILQETSGNFLSLTGPRLVKASSPEAVGYVYTCKFEKEDVVLTNYYRVDEDKVEGFFVNSSNLRKISQ
jgi:O-glycosyl hydrolase